MFWQRSKRVEADTITNLTLSNYFITYWSFKKCVIKTSKVVSSMFGLSIDVLTQILESWSRRTNLTLTNHLITYWTFKNCDIKTSKVVSSKYGLSLNVLTDIFESWSRRTNLTLTNYFITYWTFKNASSKPAKWFVFFRCFDRDLWELKQNNKFDIKLVSVKQSYLKKHVLAVHDFKKAIKVKLCDYVFMRARNQTCIQIEIRFIWHTQWL